YGLHGFVSIRSEGREIARWPRRTEARLLLEPSHFEGDSTERVLRPTPLGRRGRLQVAGLSGASGRTWAALPDPAALTRPIDQYAARVEVLRGAPRRRPESRGSTWTASPRSARP